METEGLKGNVIQRTYSIQYITEINMKLISSEGNIEKTLMKVHPGDLITITRIIGGERKYKKWLETHGD